MSTFDAVLAQYEKNKNATSGNSNKVSQEDRMKKYFTTVLPKGSKGEERRIRILPTKDGSSPFVEVYFHEVQVDGKWVKIYDPKQEGKRSPLNEVYESLMQTGVESDRELARTYRSRKFYIVKVIDRDHEQDGVKFWRFKHNAKGDGVIDKIFPIFRNKGDITNSENGRDLILSLTLTKAGTGKEYTVINSVIPEDAGPLHTDKSTADEWINDELTWSDVYSKKGEDYLELVARGEVPKWSTESNKWVSASTSEETIAAPKKSTTPVVDPQEDDDVDGDLPF
jgi:gp32 DNA binding protein like